MNSVLQYIGSLFSLPDHNYLDVLLRLTYAAIIGGLIGVERSERNHDAGLRTHILVCLGATTIMILGESVHLQYGDDIGRFGAQVISGIGFLGAGCIMVKGSRVNGLTTAAGLWTTACIGLTIGIGYFFISTVTAVLLLISTKLLRPVSFRLRDKGSLCHYTLRIKIRSHSTRAPHGFRGNGDLQCLHFENYCSRRLLLQQANLYTHGTRRYTGGKITVIT